MKIFEVVVYNYNDFISNISMKINKVANERYQVKINPSPV